MYKQNSVEFQRRDFFYILILLLLYSLISGIYKIIDNQLMMLMNIPIICILFLRRNTSPNGRFLIQGYDFIFLFFLFYLVCQSIVILLNPQTNITGFMVGFFLDIIPIIGFFYSRRICFDLWAKILLIIAIVHLVFGILLYPPFELNRFLGPVANYFTDSSGRMRSVSGSLSFGNLMMYACIIAFIYKKWVLPFLLVGLIFSAQRGAWLGLFFFVILYLFHAFKQNSFKKIIIVFGIISFLCCFMILMVHFLALDFTFIEHRLSTLSGAKGERSGQWLNGLNNFINNPIGVGIGQAGHVSIRFTQDSTYLGVADGEYFRVLSEYGIGGLFFYGFLFIFFLMNSIFKHLNSKFELTVVSLTGASLIQMIGSNIGEFYFNNFTFWIIVGYFFKIVNNKSKFIPRI